MSASDLPPIGAILSGPHWPDRVRVVRVEPRGATRVLIEAVTLDGRSRLISRLLRREDLAGLHVESEAEQAGVLALGALQVLSVGAIVPAQVPALICDIAVPEMDKEAQARAGGRAETDEVEDQPIDGSLGRCTIRETRRYAMNRINRIVVDPEILVGKPVVRGTRLAVEFIIDLLAQGWSEEEILDNYPGLTREDIRACLVYASTVLKAEKIYPFALSEA